MPETRTLMARVESGKSRPPALCILMSFGNSIATAPAIAGTDRMNENRVAAARVRRRKRPVAMVRNVFGRRRRGVFHSQSAQKQRQPIFEKIQHQREQGSRMQSDVKRQSGILPSR